MFILIVNKSVDRTQRLLVVVIENLTVVYWEGNTIHVVIRPAWQEFCSKISLTWRTSILMGRNLTEVSYWFSERRKVVKLKVQYISVAGTLLLRKHLWYCSRKPVYRRQRPTVAEWWNITSIAVIWIYIFFVVNY